MPEEPKRLEWWQKFPLDDRDAIEKIRSMLELRDDEEFPEALWIIMGIHKAMECRFIAHPWSYRDLASMIIESQILLPTMRNQTKYVPGDMVTVTSMNRQGAYWHPAPLNRHLINMHGDLCIVKTEHLEAPESAITDSELNKNAKRHAPERAVIEAARPEPQDEDFLAAAKKMDEALLAKA